MTTAGQRFGCSWHVLHPDLVPLEMEPVDDPMRVKYGAHVNGEGATSSQELIALLSGEKK